MKKDDILPNEQEHIIDYQNRQIALRNRAIKIEQEWVDISDENFCIDNEPLKI